MRHTLFFALALAALAPAATAQAPTVLNVELSSFKFTPHDIVLDHGRPYVLHLSNVADGGHDFTAHEFFAAAAVAPADRALVGEGEVEVPAGEARDIHLTAPTAPGSYHLKCSHTMHKMFGMSGTILVR